MDISVSKDFAVNSKSLKDVRDFAREIFDKSPVFSEQKDELVLAKTSSSFCSLNTGDLSNISLAKSLTSLRLFELTAKSFDTEMSI